MEDAVAVINKMMATEESLILAKPIYLTQSKHRQLEMSIPRRKRSSTKASTGAKRPASTSVSRGGPGREVAQLAGLQKRQRGPKGQGPLRLVADDPRRGVAQLAGLQNNHMYLFIELNEPLQKLSS